jgi:uncharacterized membrane protein
MSVNGRWTTYSAVLCEAGADGAIVLPGNDGEAHAINAGGTIAGVIIEDSGAAHAVRWESGTHALTPLGTRCADGTELRDTFSCAINDAGTIAGSTFVQILRWDAATLVPEVLAFPNDPNEYVCYVEVIGIDPAGTILGDLVSRCQSHPTDGLARAVRWDAAGGLTVLDGLGVDANGSVGFVRAEAMNRAGATVGYATKFVAGRDVGYRAVRWEAGASAATELESLPAEPNHALHSMAYAVSDTGIAVGYVATSISYPDDERATMWGPDGKMIDLNTLIDPNSGWTLTRAMSISEDGQWIGGKGQFQPIVQGPFAPYARLWAVRLSEAADFSSDGKVDGIDFLIWQAHYGRFPTGGATKADGDANGDGKVDGLDFLNWQTRYHPVQ